MGAHGSCRRPSRPRRLTPSTLVAAVAPLVPAWRVDRTFDYIVPEPLVEKLERGSIVRVPFGGRKVRGVVMNIAPHQQAPEGLHEVLGLVFEVPLVPPPLDRLFLWLSRRYIVPLGKALDRAVPPRVRIGALARPEIPDLRTDTATPLLESYDGGYELTRTLRAGGSGAWCVQVRAGEDRSALIAEMVSLTAGPARKSVV